MRLTVVELIAADVDDVSKVSTYVALDVGMAPRVPVGTEGRLKVWLNSIVPVLVSLILLVIPTAAADDCTCVIEVKFAPSSSLLEERSVSLAGICAPKPCDVIVAVTAL